MATNSRGESAKLTKPQRRELMLKLKYKALGGDMEAAHALSNFELAVEVAEVRRTQLYRAMDNASTG